LTAFPAGHFASCWRGVNAWLYVHTWGVAVSLPFRLPVNNDRQDHLFFHNMEHYTKLLHYHVSGTAPVCDTRSAHCYTLAWMPQCSVRTRLAVAQSPPHRRGCFLQVIWLWFPNSMRQQLNELGRTYISSAYRHLWHCMSLLLNFLHGVGACIASPWQATPSDVSSRNIWGNLSDHTTFALRR